MKPPALLWTRSLPRLLNNLFTLCTTQASGLRARIANIHSGFSLWKRLTPSFIHLCIMHAFIHSHPPMCAFIHSFIHALTHLTDICKASAQHQHTFTAHGQKEYSVILSDHHFPQYTQSLWTSCSQHLVHRQSFHLLCPNKSNSLSSQGGKEGKWTVLNCCGLHFWINRLSRFYNGLYVQSLSKRSLLLKTE